MALRIARALDIAHRLHKVVHVVHGARTFSGPENLGRNGGNVTVGIPIVNRRFPVHVVHTLFLNILEFFEKNKSAADVQCPMHERCAKPRPTLAASLRRRTDFFLVRSPDQGRT